MANKAKEDEIISEENPSENIKSPEEPKVSKEGVIHSLSGVEKRNKNYAIHSL
jgi:hypothetical protein